MEYVQQIVTILRKRPTTRNHIKYGFMRSKENFEANLNFFMTIETFAWVFTSRDARYKRCDDYIFFFLI